MTDPIRTALERAARELELSAIALRQSDSEGFAKRAQNEAHAARAALAKEQGKGPSDEELESVARAAEIQDMREQGGLGANDANGIQVQLQRQRLAGLRAVFNLDRQSALSADDIPLGPLSEHELREQWNQQADEFNQWDSLDSCEQLAWAQARAIQRDRNARPTPPAEGEVPAVLESKEPASVADHDNPIQEALNKLEEYDHANPYHDCRDLIAAARVALDRWGYQPAPPAEGEVGELVAWLNDASDQATDAGWDGDATNLTRCRKVLQQQQAEIERALMALSEREASAVEALKRLRRWGRLSGGGYSADVVLGVVDWIDGGMEGPLPPLPAHALPMPEGEVE